MNRAFSAALLVGASLAAAVPLAAQASGFVPESIVITGLRHVDPRRALSDSRLKADTLVSYREVQRAIKLLYATGAYSEVAALRGRIGRKDVLILRFRERPLLA